MRLLRPIHPYFGYASTHLAAIPFRCLVALPITVVLLLSSASDLLIDDPARLSIFILSLVGAWLLTFFALLLIGALGLFLEKSLSIMDVYLGVYGLFSGYLVPLELLPEWVQRIAEILPFRYMLAFPVELLIGKYDTERALIELALQWAFTVVVILAAVRVWKAGIRRYEAYGA